MPAEQLSAADLVQWQDGEINCSSNPQQNLNNLKKFRLKRLPRVQLNYSYMSQEELQQIFGAEHLYTVEKE